MGPIVNGMLNLSRKFGITSVFEEISTSGPRQSFSVFQDEQLCRGPEVLISSNTEVIQVQTLCSIVAW